MRRGCTTTRKEDPERYSYAKLMDELSKKAKRHGISRKTIGHEKFERLGIDYAMHRFTVNPKAKKRFCIAAGVQAYEIAGPLTMLTLFDDPQKYLSKSICYYIYPVINPTSFDLRQRNDDDGVDLNTLDSRTLRSRNYREVRAFYSDIRPKNFDAFLSLHEDLDERRFYAYVFEKEPVAVYRDIINAASKYAGIWKEGKIYGDASDGEGLVINYRDRSFECALFYRNKAKISLCTETPGLLPLKKRIAMNIANIKIISKYIADGTR